MPLIVTPADPAADSYLSVAGADAFAAADLGRQADKWLEGTTTTAMKEAALRRATRDIDRAARFTYAYAVDQRLRFPRVEDLDLDGDPFIPRSLEEATYEQAAYVLLNANVIDDAQTRRARQLTNFSEPDVSGSVADSPEWGVLSPRAMQLLEPLTVGGAVVGWIETT